jgi:deoxyribodipyrimidine photolyase-like uncharacterized protein
MLDDPHSLCSRADFARWVGRYRGSLRMEFFDREMRRSRRVLLDERRTRRRALELRCRQPQGGHPKAGPGSIPPPWRAQPDAITREVIAAAENAYRAGHAPPAATEGFIRQILGWRGFIRGAYWLDMPCLAQASRVAQRGRHGAVCRWRAFHQQAVRGLRRLHRPDEQPLQRLRPLNRCREGAAQAAKNGKPVCPFTQLYWRFVDRHEAALAANPRTVMMARNVARLDAAARGRIRSDTDRLLEQADSLQEHAGGARCQKTSCM